MEGILRSQEKGRLSVVQSCECRDIPVEEYFSTRHKTQSRRGVEKEAPLLQIFHLFLIPVSQTQPEPIDKKAPGDRAQRVSAIVLKMEGERRHVTELMCRGFWGRQVEKGVGAASGDRHGRRGGRGGERSRRQAGPPFMRGCSSRAVAT